MVIFPKYRVGDYSMHYRFSTTENKHIEEIFQVRERSIVLNGWIPEWSYSGWFYTIEGTNPLEFKFSTTGAILEKDFVPLEARLMQEKQEELFGPKTLVKQNPKYKDIDIIPELG